jgi:hypothetical protein
MYAQDQHHRPCLSGFENHEPSKTLAELCSPSNDGSNVKHRREDDMGGKEQPRSTIRNTS